jgi:hypothetical protein
MCNNCKNEKIELIESKTLFHHLLIHRYPYFYKHYFKFPSSSNSSIYSQTQANIDNRARKNFLNKFKKEEVHMLNIWNEKLNMISIQKNYIYQYQQKIGLN